MSGSKRKTDRSAFECAVDILAHRDHSTAELTRKLRQRKYDTAEISVTLTKLTDLHYLDDRRFARLLVKDRVVIRRRGFHDARSRLLKAGVDRELAEEVIEEYRETVNEREVAWEVALRRWKQIHDEDPRRKRDKVGRHLAGRGFSIDSIRSILDALMEHNFEEDT